MLISPSFCRPPGGRSRFVCIYHVGSKALVKKFQVSHDRRLDGVLDELHSGALTEGGPVEEMELDDSEDEGGRGKDALPGAKRKEDGSRNARLEVRRVGRGREWIDFNENRMERETWGVSVSYG